MDANAKQQKKTVQLWQYPGGLLTVNMFKNPYS